MLRPHWEWNLNCTFLNASFEILVLILDETGRQVSMARVTIGLCLGISALILTFGSQPARADETSIVVNGGFETGDLTGWTETGDNSARCFPAVSVQNLGPASFCGGAVNTFPPHSGQYAAFFNNATTLGAGTISQTLLTTAGDTYNLTFWLDTFAAPTTPNEFTVMWGTQQVLDLVNIDTNNSYRKYSVNVTATGSNTTLSLIGTNNPSSTGLDDVSVSAVPEPSTLVLLGTGLVAVMALVLKKSAG